MAGEDVGVVEGGGDGERRREIASSMLNPIMIGARYS